MVSEPTWCAQDVGQIVGQGCPWCDADLRQEHAHVKCFECGWVGKCCE